MTLSHNPLLSPFSLPLLGICVAAAVVVVVAAVVVVVAVVGVLVAAANIVLAAYPYAAQLKKSKISSM